MWNQIYNPLGNATLSTIAAAIPVVTLLVLIASGKVKAHIAALVALIVANIIAIFIYAMPAAMSVKASLLGVVVGFFPIGWIVLNVIFLYRITVRIVPFWVVCAFAGWKGMKDVSPAILVTGVSFAIPQFVISNYINPWIVDIGASLISMGCLILFLKVWQPKQLWLSPALRGRDESAATMAAPKSMDRTPLTQSELWSALLPWIIVCIVMLIWGTGWFKAAVNPIFTWNYAVPELHNMINKVPPVVATPTKEAAVFSFTYLSFTGTGMLIAAIISGILMGFSPARMIAEY